MKGISFFRFLTKERGSLCLSLNFWQFSRDIDNFMFIKVIDTAIIRKDSHERQCLPMVEFLKKKQYMNFLT